MALIKINVLFCSLKFVSYSLSLPDGDNRNVLALSSWTLQEYHAALLWAFASEQTSTESNRNAQVSFRCQWNKGKKEEEKVCTTGLNLDMMKYYITVVLKNYGVSWTPKCLVSSMQARKHLHNQAASWTSIGPLRHRKLHMCLNT